MFQSRRTRIGAVALASFLCQTSNSVAQTAVAIESLATTNSRWDWVTIAVPPSEIPAGYVGGSLQTLGWPAYVGRTLGAHTTLVHVRVDSLAPNTPITDTIDFDYNGLLPAFAEHPWATAEELVPWLEVTCPDDTGIQQTFSFITNPTAVQKTVVHQDSSERITRFQARVPNTPFFTRAYLYQFRDSPVAHWDVQLVHSDPDIDVLEWDVDDLVLETLTPHRIDLASALGATSITTVPGRFAADLLAPCTLGDGSRPTWTGVSVGQPSYGTGGGWTNPSHVDFPDIQSGLAALDDAMVGCAGQGVWNGQWLALRHVPAMPSNTMTGIHFPPTTGGYWDSRNMGLFPWAGAAGGQRGFGATKGGEIVSTGDPARLAWYSYRLTEHLRPSAYYDASMDLVLKANHANWATWQGRTWYMPSAGWTDTLGKTLQVGNAQPVVLTETWQGADEQHYGHLELAAYYALTGRKFAEMLIHEEIQVWLAALHEIAPDESRGLGRTWLDMSAFYWLTLDSSIPAEILSSHANELGNWQAAIAGPVKAYSRMTPAAMGYAVSGSAWQLALVINGLEAAYLITADTGIAISALDCLAAFIEAGWWVDGSSSHNMVDYWLFANGAVPTPAYYGTNGNVAGFTTSGTGYYDWAAHATKLASLLLTGSLQTEAAGAVSQRYSTVPVSWEQAEWR